MKDLMGKKQSNMRFFFRVDRNMSINELSHDTIEELCGALEKVPTLNWKVLVKSRTFCSIYKKEEDVALIGSSKVFIDDMILREIKLQHLLDGLNEIGNKKAVSIIKKGSYYFISNTFNFSVPKFECVSDR